MLEASANGSLGSHALTALTCLLGCYFIINNYMRIDHIGTGVYSNGNLKPDGLSNR